MRFCLSSAVKFAHYVCLTGKLLGLLLRLGVVTRLDRLDRSLLSALYQNSRVPIATLAGQHGVSRATIQARINRLLSAGVIRRFTIETGGEIDDLTVRALTSMQLQGVSTRAAARSLGRLPAIHRLHTTNGTWDLIAEIRVGSLAALDEVLAAIRAMPGVRNTETSILLSTFPADGSPRP
jgi:DNA-binding Lrp family transcriptional regulator